MQPSRVVALEMPHKEFKKQEKHLVPQLSHTKRPGDGFFQYVNQQWIKNTHIPSWGSDFGASDEIQKRTDKELKEILDGLNANVKSLPTNPKEHLATFSNIWHSSKAENEEGFIGELFHQLLYSNERDLARFFGWICSINLNTIIKFTTDIERHPPYLTRPLLYPGRITLPTSIYFTQRSAKNAPVWKEYLNFINLCAVELGLPFLHKAIDAEIAIANIFDKYDDDENPKELSGRGLIKLAPELYWQEFMEGLNIDNWKTRMWLIDSPDYFKRILKWMCTTSQENVVAVFALHLLNFSADYLRPSIREAAFKLRKALTGAIKPLSKEQHFISDIKSILPDALCIEYASKEMNKQKLKNVQNLISNLRESAIDVMRDNTILSERTTLLTLEKIRRMIFEVGKGEPEEIPRARYYENSIIQTMISISEARNDAVHKKLGKRVNRFKSDYPCFIVNASYYEDTNRIVIPWGILQWPFYSDSASLAWNYGGIGATVGHEITHAFDLDGIKYSPRAVYREWWTRKNRNSFKKRTRKVAKFYSKFKHYGIHLDGEQTVNEDWADLGGLKIALNALKRELKDSGSNEAETKDAIKTFFISYGMSWKEIIRRKKLLMSIKQSVHSPAEDRVDRIVPHFQDWVDIFDVKKGDALFIPESERLKFF